MLESLSIQQRNTRGSDQRVFFPSVGVSCPNFPALGLEDYFQLETSWYRFKTTGGSVLATHNDGSDFCISNNGFLAKIDTLSGYQQIRHYARKFRTQICILNKYSWTLLE